MTMTRKNRKETLFRKAFKVLVLHYFLPCSRRGNLPYFRCALEYLFPRPNVLLLAPLWGGLSANDHK